MTVMRKTIVYGLLALFIVISAIMFIVDGHLHSFLEYVGLSDSGKELPYSSNSVNSWERSLGQLNYDADIVFFGDSITSSSDFRAFFPNKKICNLGIGGDTLYGMTERVSMIGKVKPDKVFVLGGINSLNDKQIEESVSEFEELTEKLKTIDAQIFIISVLPVSSEIVKQNNCSNNTIMEFNNEVQRIAMRNGYNYIDLYSKMIVDGFMNPAYTIDGLHLNTEGYKIYAETIRSYIEN